MEKPVFPDEPYIGVRSLFNGDLQAKMDFDDRKDWIVESKDVIVYIGESALDGADVTVESK